MEYYKNLDLEDIFYFCEFDLVWKTEQWEDIIGYEGLYQISDLGRVKSKNYWHKKIDGIKKQSKVTGGYLSMGLNKESIQITALVHRLVAIAFIPNPENKPEVNHLKGIKTDNRAVSLEWNTSKENMIHSFKNNLCQTRKGNESHYAKLTEKEVFEIRNSTEKQVEISKRYNISQQQVSKIKNRTRWSHI